MRWKRDALENRIDWALMQFKAGSGGRAREGGLIRWMCATARWRSVPTPSKVKSQKYYQQNALRVLKKNYIINSDTVIDIWRWPNFFFYTSLVLQDFLIYLNSRSCVFPLLIYLFLSFFFLSTPSVFFFFVFFNWPEGNVLISEVWTHSLIAL